MEHELCTLGVDKIEFLEKLVKKKSRLENTLSIFFMNLEQNIRDEYDDRVNKIKNKTKEIEKFIEESENPTSEDGDWLTFNMPVSLARDYKLTIDDNLRYRKLLKSYTVNQLKKLDDLISSLDMFKEIILPHKDADHRLSNIRKSYDTGKVGFSANGNGNGEGHMGRRAVSNSDLIVGNTRHILGQKIDEVRNSMRLNRSREKLDEIDFNKIEVKSSLNMLKNIKYNVLNERHMCEAPRDSKSGANSNNLQSRLKNM